MRFNPNTSIFAGMSVPQLQAALSAAQNALIALQSGAQAVDVSYAQGDGNRRVTYRAPEIGGLTQLIKALQAQLGVLRAPRRGITPVFNG